MTPIDALIIDDEAPARMELRRLLEDFPGVRVCGEAANAREALRLVEELGPGLLFLDIEMPGRSGFEFLEALPPPHPHVIFTTAYDEFAIRAFEVSALDYLLKPVHPRRLAAALAKIPVPGAPPAAAGQAAPEEGGAGALREDDRVFVRDGDRCWFVPVRDIRLLESEGNHTRVYFGGEKPLLHRTTGSLEERLPAGLFIRANRSQLVNLAFVEKVSPWFSGGLKVALAGGPEVEFSRRQARVLRERRGL